MFGRDGSCNLLCLWSEARWLGLGRVLGGGVWLVLVLTRLLGHERLLIVSLWVVRGKVTRKMHGRINLGIKFSPHTFKLNDFWTDEYIQMQYNITFRIAGKFGEHQKFGELALSRYWWNLNLAIWILSSWCHIGAHAIIYIGDIFYLAIFTEFTKLPHKKPRQSFPLYSN